MTWMQQFFGIDAAAQVRRGLAIAGMLLIGWMLIVFMIAPINAKAGIDASVSFAEAPASGSIVTGINEVVATGQAVSGIRMMSIGFELAEGGIGSIPADAGKSATYELGTASARLSLTWDSTKMTPYNGNYRLVASADSTLGDRATAQIAQLKVNNPPAQPADIRVALDASGAPVLTWSPNLEPDLIGYRISRVSAEGVTPLGSVTTPSMKDAGAPEGVAVRYEVSAVRSSPVRPDGIASPASISTPLTIPSSTIADLPTTPTTVPDLAPASAPAPVKAKQETVVAPNRNVGFEEYLPYEQPIPLRVEPPIEAPSTEATFDESQASPMTPRRVELIKYLAASFLLLVGALHTARMARRVLISV